MPPFLRSPDGDRRAPRCCVFVTAPAGATRPACVPVTAVRCSSCLLSDAGGKPLSPEASAEASGSRSGGTVPTQNVVREIIEITTSSSSSQVWKLGIGPLSAAQRQNWAVGPLWGGHPCPVVDMWTDRPPCTRSADRPRPVPVLPPVRPQRMRRSTGPVDALRRASTWLSGKRAGQDGD